MEVRGKQYWTYITKKFKTYSLYCMLVRVLTPYLGTSINSTPPFFPSPPPLPRYSKFQYEVLQQWMQAVRSQLFPDTKCVPTVFLSLTGKEYDNHGINLVLKNLPCTWSGL